ncbi:MAG TPA: ion transporter, partial [Burkholderiaceae bacterium]|nr:ion transporter [Burkholderiaceae bacterium]
MLPDPAALPPEHARTPWRRLRAQTFAVLHAPDPGNRVARWVNYLLATLIIANATAITLQSLPRIDPAFDAALHQFEMLSTAIFLVEYVARVWTCVEQRRLAHPLWGRLRFMVQPLALIDLIAVATYWTPWDLRFLRVIRLVRLLKILHLYEFEAALERLGISLSKRKELLMVSVTLMAMFVYVAAALLYQIEHERQPQVFSSIPATFWWASVTFNTIGYGDMVPLTSLGKLFAGLVSVFGIGVFALPTAIVIAAIIESSSSGMPYVCDECGHHGTTAHAHAHHKA